MAEALLLGVAPKHGFATYQVGLGTSMTNRRILLADDDCVVTEILGWLLQRENYVVHIAENGHQVVEMWDKCDYDLILMDVHMPV